MKKRLEYHDGVSHKFWEISRKGSKVTKSWGRVGTDGQQQVKDLGSSEKAKTFVEKAIAEKLSKGYVETDSGDNKHPEKFDLEKALDAGPRRNRMPADFTEAYRKWQSLEKVIPADILDAEFYGSSVKDEVNRMYSAFARACWAWEPKIKCVSYKDIDRLGEHFLGPPYTCKGYEWPIFADDRPGRLIAQIDLDKASQICGVNIGNELLQLFEVPDWVTLDSESRQKLFSPMGAGYVLRKIPRSSISLKKLTPIPQWTNAQLSRFSQFGEFDPDRKCAQIIGFTEKRFSFPAPDIFHDWFLNPDLSDDFGLDGSKRQRFETLQSQLSEVMTELGEKYHAGPHLFGSFYPIQYTPVEKPVPLLCLDTGLSPSLCDDFSLRADLNQVFTIYGDGNGQIFMKQVRNNRAEFFFEGSR